MDIRNIISKHPAYKEIAGAFARGYESFMVSSLPVGIRSVLLDLLGKLFHGSFVYSTDKNINFHVIDHDSSYTEVLQFLENLHFCRANDLDANKSFRIKGDTIFIKSPAYDNVIRLDFWGESLEEIYSVSDITYKKLCSYSSVLLTDENVTIYNPLESFSGVKVIESKEDFDYQFDFIDIFPFHSNLQIFHKQVDHLKTDGYAVLVSTKYKNRLESFGTEITFINDRFVEGWKSEELKVAVYTDSELFDSVIPEQELASTKFSDLQDIDVGDYVVHRNHGVAKYGGLKVVEVDGNSREYLTLLYAKQDKLFVPREQSALVTKYIGTGKDPHLTRLGTQEWDHVKNNVQKVLESITFDLLRLYAAKEIKKGFSFSKDTNLVEDFVKEFPFEETRDQISAWNEIRFDMEQPKPMDRLLVGDVGFGKTELAMRAAFKAVQDGKQVALLAPTTVLVEQHYAVFKERMKNYPINIEVLSRFREKGEVSDSLKSIELGMTDIVIGTHRMLSKDVSFNNLGLLIVDEEQRFGVQQKESVRMLRENVDVLSMSATPIPRSLNMALSGIRDISVLFDPPKGRISVKTDLSQFNYSKISAAIRYEVERGGQVYLVHNNVRTINSFVRDISEKLPEIRFIIGHGQMPTETLSSVMRRFLQKEFDVLVCTTIIENGIDMPNVNTIIIDNSQNFGLSQLHQLRGRVGRSDKQAFCYLFYPEGLELDGLSKSRLDTLVEAQELGAGFRISTKDLELRGVGNLLGREQSGNISAVGYSLYVQLLKEQIRKSKSRELFNSL